MRILILFFLMCLPVFADINTDMLVIQTMDMPTRQERVVQYFDNCLETFTESSCVYRTRKQFKDVDNILFQYRKELFLKGVRRLNHGKF